MKGLSTMNYAYAHLVLATNPRSVARADILQKDLKERLLKLFPNSAPDDIWCSTTYSFQEWWDSWEKKQKEMHIANFGNLDNYSKPTVILLDPRMIPSAGKTNILAISKDIYIGPVYTKEGKVSVNTADTPDPENEKCIGVYLSDTTARFNENKGSPMFILQADMVDEENGEYLLRWNGSTAVWRIVRIPAQH